MPQLQIDRDSIAQGLADYIDILLALPEVRGIRLCGIEIRNDACKQTHLTEAFQRSYHDICSDSDICILVDLPTASRITPREYIRHPSRWGITPAACLGYLLTGELGAYRVIFRDGTRYDICFEFRQASHVPDIDLPEEPVRFSHPQWPVDKVDAFWFIMIQALGKLYRQDYLISSHLANMNINDTLVQQMILRDMEYGTNHHRYGYREELVYRRFEGQHRFLTGEPTFDMIADRLYAAALAYDSLTAQFYPDYEPRSETLFAIWQCYHDHRTV